MAPLLRAQVALLAATAASATVSVFAAQVGLALIGLVHLARTVRRETRGFALPVDAAVGAFAIWTFLSAAFAASPIAAHESAKKLVLFFLLYFAAEALRAEESRERVLDGLLMGGLPLAALAVLQYAFLGYDTMDARPRSFLGHYMTASGVIMILLIVAAHRILSGGRALDPAAPGEGPPAAAVGFGRAWPSRRAAGLCLFLIGLAVAVMLANLFGLFATEVERVAILAIAVCAGRRGFRGSGWPDASASNALALAFAPIGTLALVLSRTRSAWLGVIAGLAILAWIKRPRLLLFLPGAVGLVLLLSPHTILDRLTLTDASSRDRYYMWQAGLDMIMDKPIFGQGTGMILDVYPKFRWQGAPNPNAPHLHNNFIQIAAERGLPCLVFLIWLLYLLGREAWRARRSSGSGALVLAALGATLTAGMFEYTLGDSEVLMVILVLVALPFSARGYSKDPVEARERAALSAPSGPEDPDLVLEQ